MDYSLSEAAGVLEIAQAALWSQHHLTTGAKSFEGADPNRSSCAAPEWGCVGEGRELKPPQQTFAFHPPCLLPCWECHFRNSLTMPYLP